MSAYTDPSPLLNSDFHQTQIINSGPSHENCQARLPVSVPVIGPHCRQEAIATNFLTT